MSGLIRPTSPRFAWDERRNALFLHTDTLLSPTQVEKAREWALRFYDERLSSAAPGPTRDMLARIRRAVENRDFQQLLPAPKAHREFHILGSRR